MSIISDLTKRAVSVWESFSGPAVKQEFAISDPTHPHPDPDEAELTLLSSGSRLGQNTKSLDEPYRIQFRKKARRIIRVNPHGKAIHKSLLKYALGGVVKPKWGDEIDSNADRRASLNAYWLEVSQACRWDERVEEILTRLVRDGEVFLRKFTVTVKTVGMDGERIKRKMPTFRFIDPELIMDPEKRSEDDGIVTDPDDIETIISFKKVKASDLSKLDETIDADDIIFVKVETDMNEKRGATVLASIIPFAEMYDGWLQDRIVLSRVRSSVALVRTFDGTATQVKSALSTENTDAATNTRQRGEPRAPALGADTKQKRFRPGTVINATKGVKYEFIAPNLQAADVQHDGRAIQLAIVAGTGLAEFMVTGDASNSSYASTLISEGPVIKEIVSWRQIVARVITPMWVWAVEWEREHGNKAKLPMDYDPRTVEWNWPQIVIRNRVHEVQSNIKANQAGMMSRRTAMERDDLDPETEQARMIAEKADASEILGPPTDDASRIGPGSLTAGKGAQPGGARPGGTGDDAGGDKAPSDAGNTPNVKGSPNP